MANSYLYISPALSLQMSVVESIDGCTILPTLDNQLYCQNKPLGYTVPVFYQPFQTCDDTTLQFRSDYIGNVLQILDEGDNVVLTPTVNQIATDVRAKTTYEGFVSDDGFGQTKLFFNQIAFPPITDESTIEITNNANFNGTYTPVQIGYDSDIGKNFALINVVFVGADPQDVTVLVNDDNLVYNIFESTIDWGLLSEGTYRARITATGGVQDILAFSEWVSLKTTHEQTHLISYKNSVNDWAIDYSNGIENKIRVQAYFYKRTPAGEQITFIDDEKLIKVHAKVRRFIDFEITKAPPWLHEKLSLAFAHDNILVDGLEHQTSETYDPEYNGQNALSNGTIKLEQVSWTGDYNPEIQDNTTPFFRVSPAMSLQMLVTQTPDGCTILQNHDNTLYCDDKPLGYRVPTYYQIYQQCDQVTLQFRSNFQTNEVKIYDVNDIEVSSIAVVEKIDNLTGDALFDGFVDDSSDANVRVYFDQAIFPNIAVTDQVTLSANPSFNGTYTVTAISYDVALNKSYLTINLVSGSTGIKDVIIGISNASVGYNVYEAFIDWSLLAEGYYYVTIEATDPQKPNTSARSEWIDIRETHLQTHLVTYKNLTDEFDMNYSTCIENTVRVQSYFYKRNPNGEQDVFVEAETAAKFGARVRRYTDFEITKTAPWMHEKLALAFSHDYFAINGIEHQTEDLYEPEYLDQYSLSSGSLPVEQVNWIGANTQTPSVSEPIGLITETGFILVYEGLVPTPIIQKEGSGTGSTFPEFSYFWSGIYTDEFDACDNVGGLPQVEYFSHDEILNIRSLMYTVSGDKTSILSGGWYFDSSAGKAYHINSIGEIDKIHICLIEFEYMLVGPEANDTLACESLNADTTLYSQSASLVLNDVLYQISANPNSFAADGVYMQRGTDNIYTISGAAGEITGIGTTCPETTHPLTSGFINDTSACAAVSSPTNFYSRDAVIVIGSVIYTTSMVNNSFALSEWYKDAVNDQAIQVGGNGLVLSITDCSLTEYAHTLIGPEPTSLDACNADNPSFTAYSSDPTIGIGSVVYTTSGVPTSYLAAGFYQDFVNSSYIEITGAVGVVADAASCLA